MIRTQFQQYHFVILLIEVVFSCICFISTDIKHATFFPQLIVLYPLAFDLIIKISELITKKLHFKLLFIGQFLQFFIFFTI